MKFLKNKPNYCFIDFFSTKHNCMHEIFVECLETIVYKFTKSNCKLIFLFFLHKQHSVRTEFYNYIKQYLTKNNLYCIDINDYLKFDTSLIRDLVHTTEVGSKKYAEIIYSLFEKDKHKIMYPQQDLIEPRFCHIKKLCVNKTFSKNIILEGDCLIIGFRVTIGPSSGLIKINDKIYSIWDNWSHYDREGFRLKQIELTDNLEIEILQTAIDYSTCNRPMKYDGIKKLIIIDIYYVGSHLSISGY